MSASPLNLSILIHTKNAAQTLPCTLKSVRELVADGAELIVMDMFSSDDTIAVAKKAGARVLKSDKDYGYVEPARNQAIQAAKNDWILILDADEEISSSAQKLLLELLSAETGVLKMDDGLELVTADAYWLPRQNLIWNHAMEKSGWWPDFQLRFFRKGSITWESKIHSQPKITGTQTHWPADPTLAIIHHNYQTVEQFVERMNRYTSQEVTLLGATAIAPSDLLRAFRQEWFSRLFEHGGIDEGIHGVGLAQLQAMYQVLVLLKQWQAADFPQYSTSKAETQAMLQELRQFTSELRYWTAYWQIKKMPGLRSVYWRVRRRLRI
jgi:glycosyltransferase involved in cell wall biosynthesis